MKTFNAPALIALASIGFSAHGSAQTVQDSHGGHGSAMQLVVAAETPPGEGVVKKIDKSAGRVILSHGPLPGGMPAMTMAYRVKEAAWIDKMKEGQKIRFAAEQVDGAMTLVRFELTK